MAVDSAAKPIEKKIKHEKGTSTTMEGSSTHSKKRLYLDESEDEDYMNPRYIKKQRCPLDNKTKMEFWDDSIWDDSKYHLNDSDPMDVEGNMSRPNSTEIEAN